MSHAPWSISKANVAKECSLRFHLRYIRKHPGEPVARSDGRIGTAVHVVQEKMIKGETYANAFRGAALNGDLTHKEILALMTFESAVQRFMTKLHALKEKVKILSVATEQQVAITKDLEPCDYWDKQAWLRGVIDLALLVERNGEASLMVIDHKSGQIKDLDGFMPQLNSYLVMGKAVYPQATRIQPAIHWLGAEEALQQPVVQWTPIRSTEEIAQEVAPSIINYITEAETAASSTPTPSVGWYCDFCEYRQLCPAAK